MHLFARGAVLIASFTPPKPPDSCEACVRRVLCLDGGEVRHAVAFSLLNERCGDLGTHSCGFLFDPAKRGGALVVLGTMRGALGVEPIRGLLPPLGLLVGALSFTVESGEFFRDAAYGAVLDDSAH